MVTFLGATEEVERLERRVRRLLGSRPAVHLDELRMRLGMDKTAIQAALEALIERGEVERLRPIDCNREDQDFFRVNRPAPTCAVQKWRDHVRLSGMSVAWLAD
ncbi:MAG: hypothetical protein R6X19_00400 [Kiritimatiellia bacterium]